MKESGTKTAHHGTAHSTLQETSQGHQSTTKWYSGATTSQIQRDNEPQSCRITRSTSPRETNGAAMYSRGDGGRGEEPVQRETTRAVQWKTTGGDSNTKQRSKVGRRRVPLQGT